MISFELDARAIEKASSQISLFPKLYPQAAKHAMARALQAMRERIAEKTSELYYIKSSAVKKATVIKDVGLLIRGPRKNLSDYMIAPRAVPKRYPYSLVGAVKKSGGLKKLPSGFLVPTRNKTLAFLRYAPGKGNHWRGVSPITAPSVAQIVKNPEIIEATIKRGQEVFSERMKYEMMREIGAVK